MSSYPFGQRNYAVASSLPFRVKFGAANDRREFDDSLPNDWVFFVDDAAKAGKIPWLNAANPSDLTRFINPSGVDVYALALRQLTTPATPTITNAGTVGSTAYGYKIVAVNGFGVTLGSTAASAAGSTATGNATLGAVNFNKIAFTAVTGARYYDIYRTMASGTPNSTGKIGSVTATIDPKTNSQTATYSFSDTGIAADGSTAPAANTTGRFSLIDLVGDLSVIQLATPALPVVTVVGVAGSTTCTYKVVAKTTNGVSAASAGGSTTTANATQTTANYNTITWDAVPGAISYDIYRTAGGAAQGKIANVLASATLSLNDTALAGDSAAAPTLNTTGGLTTARATNYIATETGSNNAIAGALLDATGAAVPQVAGLRVTVKLAHTLQAGANTFALNGGSATGIKSHLNVANNIAAAYAATGIIDLFFDGTEYVDMAQ